MHRTMQMFNISLEMPRTVSIFWAMYKWQIMLISCIPNIRLRKNLLVDIKKAFVGPPQYIKKFNDEIRTFSNPHFPVFGQNWRFCLNRGKYGFDFVHIRETADQRKPVFGHISHSRVFCDIRDQGS